MRISTFVTFLYSILTGLRFNLIGSISVGEIIAGLYLINLKEIFSVQKSVPLLNKVLFALFLLLVGQIISDIVNNSSVQDYLRGWANIVMSAVVCIFLSINLKKDLGIIKWLLIGNILRIILFPGSVELGLDFEEMGLFKFRIAPILNSLILIGTYYMLIVRLNIFVSLILMAYGIFNFMFDFRSNGLIFLIIGFVLLLNFIKKYINKKNLIVIGVLFLSIFYGMYNIYVVNVLNRNIGGSHSYYQISQLNNPYNPLSLLLFGRTEIIPAIAAITDKPIFGHGSWAEDTNGKYTFIRLQSIASHDDYERYVKSKKTLYIPTHSIFFGYWVTGGIIPFIAVCIILLLIIRNGMTVFLTFIKDRSPYLAILSFLLISTIWNILFSPLGHLKSTLPISLAFLIVSHSFVSGNKIKKNGYN